MTSKLPEGQRVCIPNLLSGEFNGMIIGTFGASLDFAERQLFAQLSRSTINRVVLADSRQLNRYFASGVPLRKINRSYIACPMLTQQAHHPKYIFLLGPNCGRLIVGSGNLSIGGYAGAGECFAIHEWFEKSDIDSLQPFLSLKEMIFDQISQGFIDGVASSRIRDIFESGKWINGESNGKSTVIHNSRESLIDQFAARVNGNPVTEIIATAPFHDQSANAVDDLLTKFNPKKFSLLVQNRVTRLNVQALTRVFSKHSTKIQIMEAEVPQRYGKTLIHAKFILVRTPKNDYLLQGSANLSYVALCESGNKANVELSNLFVGKSGEFDFLINDLQLTVRKDGLSKFEPNQWESEQAEEEPYSDGPRNVCWRPPHLTGWVSKGFGEKVTIRIGERILDSINEISDKVDNGYEFGIEFDENSSERINNSTFIHIASKDNRVYLVAPYHMNVLQRLSASGNRADLLQEVGNLNLEDNEIEELIAELDRVLVIDSQSLWKLSNPEIHLPKDEDHSAPLNYSQLDWSRIGELPQIRQYGSAGQRLLFGSSDLGLILQSLTNRMKLESRRDGEFSVDDSTDDSLGDAGFGEEDPELDGEKSGSQDEDFYQKRTTSKRRVKILWKNFLKRFILGFSNPEFIDLVGSIVVIPTYVLVNHLCRRLRSLEMIDIDYLNEVQISFWKFMWGSAENIGYMDSLSGTEKKIALQFLLDHDDYAVTIVSVVDAWWDLWSNESDCIELRNTWHKILENSNWKPGKSSLILASKISNHCDDNIDQLSGELYALAAYFVTKESNHVFSRALGLPTSKIRMKSDTVMRSGRRQTCEYLDVAESELTLQMACDAIQAWKSIDAERNYFRINSVNAVAIFDEEFNENIFFDKTTGNESELQIYGLPIPHWEKRLKNLFH